MSDQRKTPREDQAWRLLSEGSSDELGKLPARIDRYSSARVRAKSMVSHLRQTGQCDNERSAIASCGNYLLFHQYYTVGKVRLAAVKSCKKHLLCPLCAIRRGAKALKAYLDRLQVIQADRGALRPYLVTFTIKNGDDLDERFAHLHSAIKRLHERRRSYRKGLRGAPWTESARAEGAVWTYEVTNRGNGWHPHAHAIWLCESEPDQQSLSREWHAITGDSMILDVRPITGNVADGFAEVFKYAMKFSELDLAQNVHAYQALRGRRLVGSFGCFRGVQVPEELTDELLEDLPYIRLLYTFRDGAGYELREYSQHEPQEPISLNPSTPAAQRPPKGRVDGPPQ